MKLVSRIQWASYFIIAAIIAAAGCSKKGDAVTSPSKFAPEGVNVNNVTYTNYIHDVVKNNCSTCHGMQGSAPQYWYNTNTYENAVEHSTRIMETIVEGSMPPPPRKPFSEVDKALFKAWIKRGVPK
jgi:uncharacterized membrane protein